MNYTDLTKAVLSAPINNARMTDLEKGTYSLVIDGDNIALVSDKKQKTRLSVNSLAAMRIVANAADAAKATNTRDARTAPEYSTLQAALVAEKVTISDATKFNVVHKIRIQDAVTDSPVFKNEHYKGYPEYVKASRKAAGLPTVTEEQRSARNAVFTEASEALRASGVKPNTPTDDNNLLLMPVFMIG